MLALRKTGPRFGLEMLQVPEPGCPGEHEVVVEVAATGVCGSDVHVYEWTPGYEWMERSLPVTLGHEFSGHIVAVGARVENLQVGDTVTAWPTSACMHCPDCLRGHPELCLHKTTIGLHQDGAFAKYVRVPAISCFRLPSKVDLSVAALCEPLCVSDNAVRVGEVAMGDTVLVLGPGTIGQCCAFIARKRGAARVIVVGKDDATRLAISAKVGATDVLDLAEGPLKQQLSERLGIVEVHRVIEATGAGQSISDGLKVLCRGGILVSAGIHARPVQIDMTTLVRSKQQIRGAHGSAQRSWETVSTLVGDWSEQLQPMITHRIGLTDALEGFELARSRQASKVVVAP